MLSSRVHRAPPPPRAGGARNPARLAAAAVPAAARGQPDARIAVKLGLARSLGKLDLSDMGLESLPAEVFELEELEELSLAGNRLQSLPDDITRLTALRKLGLAGNLLGSLPEGLGALTGLEGLWLHGNLLAALPESLGNLKALRQLSVAGNRLVSLPDSLGGMTSLEQLQASGNAIESLPDSISGLRALRLLQVNGNRIRSLPQGVAAMARLEQLCAQGNELESLPQQGWSNMSALQLINVSDNSLTALPEDIGSCPRLDTLLCYGNGIQSLPAASLAAAPKLRYIWAESNPLAPGEADRLVASLAARGEEAAPRAVGFDRSQLSESTSAPPFVRLSEPAPAPAGPGYFKLQRTAPAAGPAPVLIVAFGSAPGEPNWAGLLKRVREAMKKQAARDAQQTAPDGKAAAPLVEFDVLYVVDPSRSWYGGGSGPIHDSYQARLRAAAAPYSAVVLLGDSMGATAALTFADLASEVIAFCPQVDLSTSAIRPGTGPESWSRMRSQVVEAVLRAGRSERGTRVTIHCGSWLHDLDQARMVPYTPEEAPHVDLRVYSYDSHRLAYYLQQKERLGPIVTEAVCRAAGLRTTANVRLTNLL